MTIIADKTKNFNISLDQIVNVGIFTKKEVKKQYKRIRTKKKQSNKNYF
ncbi:MAG: hypothetical protein PHG18_02785 [Bacilli bacterium]|nr:hypothetical protein [Bacilli bacterium]